MAYPISDFDGIVLAPDSDYPYGQIVDDPNGTRINVKSSGDIWQFFQRFLDKAGMTPNGDPDNETNGFQFVAAVVNQIQREAAAIAETCGAGAGSTTPVHVAGMNVTGSVPVTIHAGWFYYNGMLVWFPGDTYTPSSYAQMTITINEGLPTGHVTPSGTLPVTDGTHFDYSAFINHPLVTLNTRVTTLESEIAFGAWANITVGSDFVAGAQVPQYRKDGMGRVYLRGFATSGTTGTNILFGTLPTGARPSQDMEIPCFYNGGASPYASAVQITSATGEITAIAVNTTDKIGVDGCIFLNS